MIIKLDPTLFRFFCNCACAYISQCALRLSPPHGPIDFDVDINYINPYSRTTYANDVKILNFEAGTAAILNIDYTS